MSIIAYLALTGARQGVIKGDVTAKGREGTIAVTAIAHEIMTPIDAPTGAVTGRRQHKPITITMVIDQATPKLYRALVTNEELTAAKMTFWRPSADGSGTEVLYFAIVLTNALIVDVILKTLAGPGLVVALGAVRYAEGCSGMRCCGPAH
jgi:type VI secretion system secreted protein Hcp